MGKGFRELLENEYVIFDGGMGTMLCVAGMKKDQIPETLNITESAAAYFNT